MNLFEEPSKNVKLLVKVYKPNIHYPNGGIVSQFLEKSETINVEFPYGKIIYKGKGIFGFR